MLPTGLLVLIAIAAVLLSTAQGWALRAPARGARHLLVWAAGTLLIGAGAAAYCARFLAPPGGPPWELPPAVLVALRTAAAVATGAGLIAGVVHARTPRPSAGPDRWMERAAVHGIALAVTAVGTVVVLVFVGLAKLLHR